MIVSPLRSIWLPGLLTLLIALLVNMAPLALGSNRMLPWAYNSVLSGVLLAVTIAWSMTVKESDRRVSMQTIAAPITLYAIVLLWAFLQAWPIAPEGLANPIWSLVGETESSIDTRSISVNPENSLLACMRLSTYACVFLCVYLLAGRSERAGLLLWLFVLSAVLYAIYGLARYAADWDKILWFSGISKELTGSFINKNSAATYLGFGIVCALALLMKSFSKARFDNQHTSLRFRFLAGVDTLAGRAGFLLVICAALLVALMLTASRAGIASTFAGCLTLAGLRIMKRGRGQAGLYRFAGLAVIAVLFLTTLEMSGGNVFARILAGDVDAGGRLDVYRMTVTAVGHNVWLGTGLGTFQDMFPVFRDDILSLGLIWDKAHNDYLELFLGLGVPAAALFLLSLMIVFVKVVRGYFARRRDSIYCSVAVSVSVIAAVHSLLDFSMQIQAIAMAYAMLLGLGMAQSRSSRDRSQA